MSLEPLRNRLFNLLFRKFDKGPRRMKTLLPNSPLLWGKVRDLSRDVTHLSFFRALWRFARQEALRFLIRERF